MRPHSFLPLLGLLAILPAWAADSGLSFEHGDWLLACDNTRTCRAAGYQADDGNGEPVSILLTRAGGPHQPVTAELMLGDYDGQTPPTSLRLRVNDQDLGPLVRTAPSATAALTPTQVAGLLKALTQDSKIVAVGNDKREWTISDQGASAVLLKMDEFQGRLETPGALMRKGQRSEDRVLPALPAPKVKQATLAATRPGDSALAQSPVLRAALQASTKQDDCGDLFSSEPPEELTVHRLGTGTLLVSAQCWMAAYNEGVGYWVVNDHTPYQPRLVTTDASDDDQGTIGASQKGRGLGDCWSTESWTWDGHTFVRTAEASTGMCRLVTAGGAWELPTYVTEVQP